MKAHASNMFAATSEDLPLFSGFALTDAAEVPVKTEAKPITRQPSRPTQWNPFTQNPLNFLDKPLPQPNGAVYLITQNIRGQFVIHCNGEPLYTTNYNVGVCFWLNVAEVQI